MFEYWVISNPGNYTDGTIEKIQSVLNHYAKQGWRVAMPIVSGGGYTSSFILEREKKDGGEAGI